MCINYIPSGAFLKGSEGKKPYIEIRLSDLSEYHTNDQQYREEREIDDRKHPDVFCAVTGLIFDILPVCYEAGKRRDRIL